MPPTYKFKSIGLLFIELLFTAQLSQPHFNAENT